MKKWNTIEESFLLKNYAKLDRFELISKLNRSWSSIRNKASSLNLKREIANANIIHLANESNEAYYWLGFLIADGHFNTNKQLQVNLSKKDLRHLVKFANFIEYKNILEKPSINVSYKEIEEWLSQFEIEHDKTYNPCKIKHLLGDKLFSFIVGFIDGDGSIDKKGCLQIKCHRSWLENLSFMISVLSENCDYKGCINSEGCSLVTLTKIEIMKKTRRHAESLNLPILERKWERIRFDKLSKAERRSFLENQCLQLFEKGFSTKDIVQKTGISKSFINNFVGRLTFV